MIAPAVVALPGTEGEPEIRLLDAEVAGLDDTGLREWARAQTNVREAGHVTRSYRYPYSLVAWHDEPVGVDIERIEPCGIAFAQTICTPAELANPALDTSDHYLTSLWCSKEALSKALGDALRYDPRQLESPLHWPAGRAGPWRARSLSAPAGHTAWLCWRCAGPSPG